MAAGLPSLASLLRGTAADGWAEATHLERPTPTGNVSATSAPDPTSIRTPGPLPGSWTSLLWDRPPAVLPVPWVRIQAPCVCILAGPQDGGGPEPSRARGHGLVTLGMLTCAVSVGLGLHSVSPGWEGTT